MRKTLYAILVLVAAGLLFSAASLALQPVKFYDHLGYIAVQPQEEFNIYLAYAGLRRPSAGVNTIGLVGSNCELIELVTAEVKPANNSRPRCLQLILRFNGNPGDSTVIRAVRINDDVHAVGTLNIQGTSWDQDPGIFAGKYQGGFTRIPSPVDKVIVHVGNPAKPLPLLAHCPALDTAWQVRYEADSHNMRFVLHFANEEWENGRVVIWRPALQFVDSSTNSTYTLPGPFEHIYLGP